MSELTKAMLESDEAPIRATARVGHDWLWPEIVAVGLAGLVVGFCVGLVL